MNTIKVSINMDAERNKGKRLAAGCLCSTWTVVAWCVYSSDECMKHFLWWLTARSQFSTNDRCLYCLKTYLLRNFSINFGFPSETLMMDIHYLVSTFGLILPINWWARPIISFIFFWTSGELLDICFLFLWNQINLIILL